MPAAPLFTNATFSKIKTNNNKTKDARIKSQLSLLEIKSQQPTKPHGMSAADWKVEKANMPQISKRYKRKT